MMAKTVKHAWSWWQRGLGRVVSAERGKCARLRARRLFGASLDDVVEEAWRGGGAGA